MRVPETRKAGAKRASSAPRFMFLWTPGAKSADFAPGSLVLRETVKTEGIEGVCLQYLPSVKEKKKTDIHLGLDVCLKESLQNHPMLMQRYGKKERTKQNVEITHAHYPLS